MAAHPTVDLFLELQTALAGRYSLDRELGRGGMGIVYLAHDVDLDRLVAIKLLPPSLAQTPAVRERFVREARTAARLSHPHIIPIYAVEQLGDFVFYVMGYVDGETLTQRVSAHGALSAGEGARMLREVSWALSYAHAQGIVHRDIKPDNILLDRQSGRAIVADFGIASAVGDVAEVACGTPEFMSPEQALHAAVDGRSDLYSLGATAFFTFSGRAPFAGATATETIARQVTAVAPTLHSVVPSLPRPLAQLVDRCLAKDPAQRPQTAQQVSDALTSALD
jgi:serine/threonine-protein kinase